MVLYAEKVEETNQNVGLAGRELQADGKCYAIIALYEWDMILQGRPGG